MTLTDVLSSIVGELVEPEAPEDRDIIRREDGSWLIDGDVGIERLKAQLQIDDDLPGEGGKQLPYAGRFRDARAPAAFRRPPITSRGRPALRGHGHGPQPGRQGAGQRRPRSTARRQAAEPATAGDIAATRRTACRTSAGNTSSA